MGERKERMKKKKEKEIWAEEPSMHPCSLFIVFVFVCMQFIYESCALPLSIDNDVFWLPSRSIESGTLELVPEGSPDEHLSNATAPITLACLQAEQLATVSGLKVFIRFSPK